MNEPTLISHNHTSMEDSNIVDLWRIDVPSNGKDAAVEGKY